jgi:hypothetical protein
MNTVQIIQKFSTERNRYEWFINGILIAKSKNANYINYHLIERKESRFAENYGLDLNSTFAITVEDNFSVTAPSVSMNVQQHVETQIANNVQSAFIKPEEFVGPMPFNLRVEENVTQWNVLERVRLMRRTVSLVASGKANGAIIGGRGGIGKTFGVSQELKNAKLVNFADIESEHTKMQEEISAYRTEHGFAVEDDDDETVIEMRVRAQCLLERNGYSVMKGYSSASALYRYLFNHNGQLIIFDDCDSILRDKDALNILKAALDTYEDRWVSWNVNSIDPNAPPPIFKFTGRIIFITNLDMHQIADPIRTRCYKVDLHMTQAQCVEYIESTAHNVCLPGVDEIQEDCIVDSINFLKIYASRIKNISYRLFLDILRIRIECADDDWARLAYYNIMQN